MKWVWDRHCYLDTKLFILWIVFSYEPFVCKVSFDYYKLLISYSRFHNLLIDMQTWWRHNFRRFLQSFDAKPYFGEPLLVPFYTSLNADISGTRKDIKKRSTVFFPVFPVLSYQRIKIFISYPLSRYNEWSRWTVHAITLFVVG